MTPVKHPPETPARNASGADQDQINSAVYYAPKVYRAYLSHRLTPAETACFAKYERNILDSDVLDVGVGAGRTARYLQPRARRYEGIDYSPVMVDYMKRNLPQISVRRADFRDLNAFADLGFDFVLATDNVIDALSHEDRLRALRETHRVLRPGGLLAFSCHNRNYKKAFSGPQLDWSANPVRMGFNCARYVLSIWNHRRVAPFRRITTEYALLNDPGHRYACLHYYATRETVRAQLANAGFTVAEIFDIAGQSVAQGGDDTSNPSLLYVARRA